jgi:hypothetical protein
MLLFPINAFKEILLDLPVLDSVSLRTSSSPIRDYSAFLFIVILNPVLLQDVFLLSMQSAGTQISATNTVFCLRKLLTILLAFNVTNVYVLLFLCNWLSCCCQAR